MLINLQREPVKVKEIEQHAEAQIPDRVILSQTVVSTYKYANEIKTFTRIRELPLVMNEKITNPESIRAKYESGKYNIIRLLSFYPIITAYETEQLHTANELTCLDDIALHQLVMSDNDPEVPVLYQGKLLYRKNILGATNDQDLDLRDEGKVYTITKYIKSKTETISFL